MRKLKFFIIPLAIIFLFGCAAMQNMTPEQKQLTYRTAFNSILEQFNGWAKLQSEETKAKLRAEVIPLLDKAGGALDLYEQSFSSSNDDPDARLNFYLNLKNELISLLLKYGLKVDERKVTSWNWKQPYCYSI